MGDDEKDAGSLEEIIAAYAGLEGVDAAALVSVDGLLVASAGNSSKLEGLAAHAASAMSSSVSLAEELGGTALRMITLNLTGQDLVLAPITEDLFLVLVGDEGLLSGARHGGSGLPL